MIVLNMILIKGWYKEAENSNKGFFCGHFKTAYRHENCSSLLSDVYVFALPTSKSQTFDRNRPTPRNLPREDRKCMKCNYLLLQMNFILLFKCLAYADYRMKIVPRKFPQPLSTYIRFMSSIQKKDFFFFFFLALSKFAQGATNYVTTQTTATHRSLFLLKPLTGVKHN